MGGAERFLEGINPEQRAAVKHVDGPLLVLAGAGSGKTRVVTRRIAYLIGTGRAEPEHILAVTFTNKAAREMRERVGALIGHEAAKRVLVSTFHAFCLTVLREHIERLGFRRNFTVSSEGDTYTLLRRVLSDLDGVRESFSAPMLKESISMFKSVDKEPEFAADANDKYATYLPEVYQRYESALRAANALDFDDLLRFTVRLWKGHPEVLEAYRKRFRFLLVDEYQDTNAVQYALVHALAGERRNVCVVGDDDQSIYGWRGADVGKILTFERDFPGAKIVTLDRNYRSTPLILRAANGVIQNNRHRRTKAMRAEGGEGRPIDWITTGDDDHEAGVIVEWLQHIQAQTGAGHGDFALLYRSNTQSRPIEIAMRGAGIPYIVVGGQEFYDRAEVRDVIAYLKLLVNPRDEAAFLRIVNVPRRGIGDATLHLVHDICRDKRCSFGQAMAEALKTGRINGQAESGVRSFLGLMAHYRDRAKDGGHRLDDIARDLVRDIGYRHELTRTSKSPEQEAFRWENVEAVLQSIERYEAAAAKPSLREFLDESALNQAPGRDSRERSVEDVVTLTTIHGAKGLEYSFVFIVGVEEGLIPHAKSLMPKELEEERRLFYVALTRAKRHVTIFEALSRHRHGKDRPSTTSRFLHEIPSELLRKRPYAPRNAPEAPRTPPKPLGKRPRKSRDRVVR